MGRHKNPDGEFTCRAHGKVKLWMMDSYGVNWNYGVYKTEEIAKKRCDEVLVSNIPEMKMSFGRGNFMMEGRIYNEKSLIKTVNINELAKHK